MTRWSLAILLTLTMVAARAEREEFILPQETGTRMWRLTNDPSWRDWANYHAMNCWSPDGSMVCTERYRAYETSQDGGPFVRVIEVATGEVLRVFERAESPRWANRHNWLFFVQQPEEGGLRNIVWWDPQADRVTQLEVFARSVASTDYLDEYVYAGNVSLADGTSYAGARVPIAGGPPEPLELGGQLQANPGHPVVFTRVMNYMEAFKPTRMLFGLDGSDLGMISPCIQQCHQSWSGGGEWYLFGNQPMKGRRWDEPFPSNQHYLTYMGCGDICRGDSADRYLVGSSATGQINLVQLRSGYGRVVIPQALSFIHDSATFQYSGDSAYYDNDAKGSPDATKICFVSCYDLRDGPLTRITQAPTQATGPGIHVASTAGFPESGRLSIRSEVVGYQRKTETTFEDLTRGMYGTGPASLRNLPAERLARMTQYPTDLGGPVTSFDARLIPEELIAEMTPPRRFAREDWPDRDTPLMWQRRTDVYVAIARTPDRPWLRQAGDGVELVPGELHFETLGYRILRDGEPVGEDLLSPGAALDLPDAGQYTAVAVERSGLESEAGNSLRVEGAARLRALADPPDDFSWTEDRWLVGEQPVSREAAQAAPEAIREIVHRYDGAIHREWYQAGALVRRHDLDPEGNAIRRLEYEDGRLVKREHWDPGGTLVTEESFDADGFITESIHRVGDAVSRWWYIKGTPVKVEARGTHYAASPDGPGTYAKQGVEWVRVQ